ncbi:MAG: exo-alpha-sialidase [Comamonadaceae bacterium]|nr:exo-alpha-sialidase [Comamonadaceae bacterium]
MSLRTHLPRLGRLSAAVFTCMALAALPAHGAPGGNRFKPVGPDNADGSNAEAGERWTAADYEAYATTHPVAGSLLGLPAANSFLLFSQCRAMGGVSYAGFTAAEHDAIVGDTPFAFATSLPGLADSCFNPQNEQNIVTHPANPNHLVTSANEYRGNVHTVYVSTDRGASWRNIVLPGWTLESGASGLFKNVDSCGDPVLAFSPSGDRLYYAGLECAGGPSPKQSRSGVAVAVSTDGGLSWSPPTMVHYTATGNFFHDKEWITVGPDGSVHLSWTWFQSTPNGKFGASPIFHASSRDGGLSWSEPHQVSAATYPYNQGSVPAVAPDGTLYVSFISAVPETGYQADTVMLARSRDGGLTWTNSRGPRIYDDANCYPTQIGGQGRQTLSAQNYRINSFPAMAVDADTGRVHIAWADNRAHPSCGYEKGGGFNPALGNTQNQVHYVYSDDGEHFSADQVLNPPNDDTVFPAVAARGGKVLVSYYTRRHAKAAGGVGGADMRCALRVVAVGQAGYADGTLLPASFGSGANRQTNVCIDYAGRLSVDGGQTFAAEARFSSESSNPWTLFTGSFIGDYTGAAIDAMGRGVAVWTDFRGNPGVTPPNQDAVVRTLP